MALVTSLIGVLESALSIWDSHEKNKYADELTSLKKAYYDEANKSDIERSDAILDSIEFSLRNLCDSFSTSVATANAQNK